MAKNNNLTDLLTDVADAIRAKKGTYAPINPQDFYAEIVSIGEDTPTPTPSRPSWTGHADVEGLKTIGWTDEDIAYYQQHGVNWNAEDDEYHKVTDDNKALYGVLTADNISTYKDRIVYLPKIDTSGKTDMSNMFADCYSLVSIPQLNTASVTDMSNMFNSCFSLVSIPQLDTASVTNMSNMFSECHSLVSIPQLNTASVTNMSYMFDGCHSLVSIPQLDTPNVTGVDYMFNICYSLTHVNLKNAAKDYRLNYSALLSKESLLYLINNEAATSAITIKLARYAYTRLAEDADVVVALANHPNISLAK
jgi:surface protein